MSTRETAKRLYLLFHKGETTTTAAIGTAPMTRLGEIPDSHPMAKRKKKRH